MNKQQFKADMNELVKALNVEDSLWEGVHKLFHGEVELWGCSFAVDLMDRIYSPTANWVSWYVWENEMGKGKKRAGYNGKNKVIKNIDDLIRLIEQEETR